MSDPAAVPPHMTLFKIEINSTTNSTELVAEQHKHANALARQDGPHFLWWNEPLALAPLVFS